MRIASRHLAAVLAFASVLPTAQRAAAEQIFEAEYAIDYLGLTVAKSSFVTAVADTYFNMYGTISSTGLAKFFDSTKGTTKASGYFGAGGVSPISYSVDYTYGKKAKKTALGYTNGAISQVDNMPALPERRQGWVGVAEKDFKGAVDPLSATLIRTGDRNKVCNRTVRIFDGEIRADIVLTPSAATPAEVPGAGKGVACSARFVPVGGYYSANASLDYLRNKSRVDITFAPLGKTGVYAPGHASVGTKFGTVTIRARRLKTSQ